MTKTTIGVLLAGCMIFGLGACSGSQDASDPHGAQVDRFDPLPGMEAHEGQVPISEADETLIHKADARLVNQCMAKQGFPAEEAVEKLAHPDPPAYLSPAELRRGGYQFDFAAETRSEVAMGDPEGPPIVTDSMSAEQAADYYLALSGPDDAKRVTLAGNEGTTSISAEGCVAEARTELYGSLRNYLRYDRAWEGTTIASIGSELRRRAGYQAPLEAWQRCMASASPIDLSADIDDGLDYGVSALRRLTWVGVAEGGGAPSQPEIDAVAKADADCQESSGLYEARKRLLPSARSAVVKRLGFEQSDLIAFQRALLERAKSVR